MESLKLNSLQLDALKEVSNIEAGNAATALSQLLNKKIDMTVPDVKIIDLENLFQTIPEDQVVAGILVRVLGDAPGNILFLFEKDASSYIIELLTGKKEQELSEMGASVLCEIGNIIASAYMGAIAKMTNLSLMPSVPGLAYDMMSSIITSLIAESAQWNESILEIQTTLLAENKDKIGGHFYYLPNPGSLQKIFNSIGII